MITYITAFIFYTLAMIGILLVGFIIYKKTFVFSKNESKGMIKILDTCPIGPKKTLMVVRIKNEKFLIASGAEHTTFLSKLSDDNSSKNISDKEKNDKYQIPQDIVQEQNTFMQKPINSAENKNTHLKKLQQQFMDLYEQEEDQPVQTLKKVQNKHQIMRKLLEELNEKNSNINAGRF